jgi:hypothetical protein
MSSMGFKEQWWGGNLSTYLPDSTTTRCMRYSLQAARICCGIVPSSSNFKQLDSQVIIHMPSYFCMLAFVQDLVRILFTLTQWYGAPSKTTTRLILSLARMLTNHYLNTLPSISS